MSIEIFILFAFYRNTAVQASRLHKQPRTQATVTLFRSRGSSAKSVRELRRSPGTRLYPTTD
jgi:hypothetical protein